MEKYLIERELKQAKEDFRILDCLLKNERDPVEIARYEQSIAIKKQSIERLEKRLKEG